ncbi:MAG: hypothetical protein WC992_00180 [Acholeplasmataceae bacterium]|jgi:hypothetical protein
MAINGLPLRRNTPIEEEAVQQLVEGSTPTVATESPPETPTAEVEETVEEAPSASVKHCQFCGRDPAQPVRVVPTDEDRQEFTRYTLAGGRWQKTYFEMGGRLRITFRSLRLRETDDVNQQLAKELSTGALNDVRVAYARQNRLQLSFALVSILATDAEDRVQTNRTFPPPTREDFRAEDTCLCVRRDESIFDEGEEGMSVAMYDLIYRRFIEWDTLQQLLMARSVKPDFSGATPSAL